MERVLSVCLLVCIALFPSGALARNTEQILPVQEAVDSGAGQKLSKTPFYMKGQKHPRVAKKIGNWMATRKTRGIFRSDEESCKIAFLSAVISLQQRAGKENGDGIINIISVTKDQKFESATKYRCIAGGVIVHVALRGDVVKFAK